MPPGSAPGSTPDVAPEPPLTARSALVSALLGEDPPELPVAHLVELAGLFGINPNRARVALSRMVAAGEAVTDGAGTYRLVGRLLERRGRQQDSLVGRTNAWDGSWRIAVVITSGSSPDERAVRRRRLGLARMAEQREGVWLRPDNIELRPDPARDPDLAVYRGMPDTEPAALAASLWDLATWSDRADRLRVRLEHAPTEGPGDLAPGFTLSASVLRHLQADPLLPDLLLPHGWPGSALRQQYAAWDRQYRTVLRTWGRGARTT